MEFKNFAAYRELGRDEEGGTFDGLLGEDQPRFFTVSRDYASSRIVPEPNSIGRKAIK